MKIQPFQEIEEEYAAWIALSQSLDPEAHLTVDVLREERKEFRQNNQLYHVLGRIDGRLIASGMWWHLGRSADEPYHFSLVVHPDYQESYVPQQMQTYLLGQIGEEQPKIIASQPKEDERYRIRLLEETNFELVMRFPRSRLAVTQIETEAYDAIKAQLNEQGIKFVTLSDIMQSDPAWQRNVWRLFTTSEQDVPGPGPFPHPLRSMRNITARNTFAQPHGPLPSIQSMAKQGSTWA